MYRVVLSYESMYTLPSSSPIQKPLLHSQESKLSLYFLISSAEATESYQSIIHLFLLLSFQSPNKDVQHSIF